MTPSQLRSQHSVFTYESFSSEITAEGLEIKHFYTIEPDIQLQAKVVLSGVTDELWQKIPKKLQQAWLFNLGLAELPSYWKLTASPKIKIKAGKLSPVQQSFWHDLLIKGMGEYFYQNQLDFTDSNFVIWESSGPDLSVADNQLELTKKSLVPVGGGKDSTLTLSLLETNSQNYGVFLLNPTPAMSQVSQNSLSQETIIAARTIDPKLLSMNDQGYLNGHVPFSAYLGFLARLAANIWGYQSVVISNEASSNEGNVTYCGHEINHQYSKTFGYEAQFANYLAQNHLIPDSAQPGYFSLLRPWYDLQIAQHLVTQPGFARYQESIVSCNKFPNEHRWCGACPKCLFTFISFYPFLDEKKLIDIFGQNLLENEALYPLAEELLGKKEIKPFECVGTHQESAIGFYLSYQKNIRLAQPIPILLQKVWDNHLVSQPNLSQVSQELLASFNQNHLVPNEMIKLLDTNQMSQKLLTQVAILFGLGKEGLSSYNFIRNQAPQTRIFLVDENGLDQLDAAWQKIVKLDQQVKFLTTVDELITQDLSQTILIKTPGVPLTHPLIKQLLKSGAKLSSNTALFFDQIKAYRQAKLSPELTVIGVTGTKGKSTTTALVHHLLSTAGKNAYLGGNIGQPALNLWQDFQTQLPSDLQPSYFVLEMSSHQLAELENSPDIAVILEISSEHLDYYPDFETYFQAKTRIVRFQTQENLIIYNADAPTAAKLANLSPADKIGFSLKDLSDEISYQNIKIPIDQVPLEGKHNINNVFPGIIIAQRAGINQEKILAGLKTFQPLPHRLELVAQVNGVKYINDSIATNPQAAMAAIEAFASQPLILLAGGHERNQDYQPMAEAIIKNQVKAVVVFPPSGDRLAQALTQLSTQAEIKTVKSMAEAIKFVKSIAQNGDVVLLSPGAASFGVFKDYQDRGHQFTKAALEN